MAATIKRQTRDLSKQAGNPTHTIETHFAELMAETDPAKLRKDVIELIENHGGLSDTNLRKFKLAVAQIGDNLTRLQSYLANYMLAGSGMGVLAISRGK